MAIRSSEHLKCNQPCSLEMHHEDYPSCQHMQLVSNSSVQMTVHVQKVLIRSESRSTAAVQLCVAVQVVARLHLNLMQSYCSDTIVSHDDRDHLCYHVVGRAHLGPHHCPHPLRGPPRRAPSPSRQVHSRLPSCRAGVLRRKNDWPRPTQWVVVTVPQYCRCSL